MPMTQQIGTNLMVKFIDQGPMCSLPCATTTVENDAVKKHQGFEQLSHLGLTSKRLEVRNIFTWRDVA